MADSNVFCVVQISLHLLKCGSNFIAAFFVSNIDVEKKYFLSSFCEYEFS